MCPVSDFQCASYINFYAVAIFFLPLNRAHPIESEKRTEKHMYIGLRVAAIPLWWNIANRKKATTTPSNTVLSDHNYQSCGLLCVCHCCWMLPGSELKCVNVVVWRRLHNKNNCHAMKNCARDKVHTHTFRLAEKQMTKHILRCDQNPLRFFLSTFFFISSSCFLFPREQKDDMREQKKSTAPSLWMKAVDRGAQQWFVIFITANPLRIDWIEEEMWFLYTTDTLNKLTFSIAEMIKHLHHKITMGSWEQQQQQQHWLISFDARIFSVNRLGIRDSYSPNSFIYFANSWMFNGYIDVT